MQLRSMSQPSEPPGQFYGAKPLVSSRGKSQGAPVILRYIKPEK